MMIDEDGIFFPENVRFKKLKERLKPIMKNKAINSFELKHLIRDLIDLI